MSSSHSVGYTGGASLVRLERILINHSYFTYKTDGIYLEKTEPDLFQVLFEGTVIRQWKLKDDKIICFFEDPHVIILSEAEVDRLTNPDSDVGLFYAPYVPLIVSNTVNGETFEPIKLISRYDVGN